MLTPLAAALRRSHSVDETDAHDRPTLFQARYLIDLRGTSNIASPIWKETHTHASSIHGPTLILQILVIWKDHATMAQANTTTLAAYGSTSIR